MFCITMAVMMATQRLIEFNLQVSSHWMDEYKLRMGTKQSTIHILFAIVK